MTLARGLNAARRDNFSDYDPRQRNKMGFADKLNQLTKKGKGCRH